MKKKIGMIAAIALFVFAACEKELIPTNKLDATSIEGTYVGTFLTDTNLKSAERDSSEATAIITILDSTLIEFHCFGADFDSTLRLNLYEDGDSLLVCLTGNNFNNEYGHMMGQGFGMGHGNGMGMGMGMGGNHFYSDTSTVWGHHLYYEHTNGDEHFGGFNRQEHSFSYSFRMMENDSIYYCHFQGIKN